MTTQLMPRLRPTATLLILLALTAACTLGAPRVSPSFSETFDDARNGWTLLHNSQADISILGGQLRIAVMQPDALVWSVAANKVYDDFVLDVDATPLAGPDDNDYGVIFRRVDDDNYYRFAISGDGYYNILKRQKGTWHKLIADWTPSNAIRKGKATNHLRVVCAGPIMSFHTNGTRVAQISDTTFARGAIGLAAGTLTQPGVQIAFDALQIIR